LPDLRRIGFTHLCTEAYDIEQDFLNQFLDGTTSMEQYRESTFQKSRLATSGKTVELDEENCNLLLLARDQGMTIVACDKLTESQAARDENMARHILEILNQNNDHRVVFWVGCIHAAIRNTKPSDGYRTAAELLAAEIGEYSILTIAQVRNTSTTNLRDQFFLSRRIKQPTLFWKRELDKSLLTHEFTGLSADKDIPNSQRLSIVGGDWHATYWCPVPVVHESV